MRETADLVLLGARRVAPGEPEETVDAVVSGGRLVTIGPGVGEHGPAGARVIDAAGMVLSPGFIDLHTHLREPGQGHKETIDSGTRAAAAGGFTTVVAMANTTPVVDDVDTLRWVVERSVRAHARVLSVGAVTVDLAGRELTDFPALAAAGAVAFSDDGRNEYGAELGERALAAAAAVGRPVLVHAQDTDTCGSGQAHPGAAAATGVTPWPCEGESEVVARMIEAVRRSGGHLHVQHVSCESALELVRAARAEGLPVTAEVTPHHLTLTEQRVLAAGGGDPLAKVNPPLREESDRAAVVEGLRDGVISAIATDHAPHEMASKSGGFSSASFGFSGLETALAVCLSLVHAGLLELARVVEALTIGPHSILPARVVPRPGLRVGEVADLVLFDPERPWTVDPGAMVSMGRNTPLAGQRLRGRVMLTVASGRLVHLAEEVLVA